MKENEFPILKITSIDWDKDHEELDKLPKDVSLRWGEKDWDKEQVSNWLSIKYDWVLNDLNIKQSGTYINDSCGCC
jgi:hypothetical protein|tara:strand:+ start:267 stop:494 length:228 start_codon:yes stop_codon:yes gene_type:complete